MHKMRSIQTYAVTLDALSNSVENEYKGFRNKLQELAEKLRKEDIKTYPLKSGGQRWQNHTFLSAYSREKPGGKQVARTQMQMTTTTTTTITSVVLEPR